MEAHEDSTPLKFWVGLVIAGACGSAIAFILCYAGAQSIRDEGTRLQNQLIETYNISEEQLTLCLDESPVVKGVIQREDPSTKDRLVGVISQFEPDVPVAQNRMAAQAAKSFPDLDQIRLDQLSEVAVACRNTFLDRQRDNQAQAQALDDWTNDAVQLLFQLFLENSVPNDQLVVVGPDGEKIDSNAALQFILEPKLL